MWCVLLVAGAMMLVVVTRSGPGVSATAAPAAPDDQRAGAEMVAGTRAAPASPAAADSPFEPGQGASAPASSPAPPAPGSTAAAPDRGAASSPRGEALLPGPRPVPPADESPGRDRPGDGAAGGGEHRLIDRTGRRGDLGRHLNQEFVPLAVECIEMAKARNPDLAGLLSFAVNLVPVEGDKVLVASVELQKDNEITDPELFECIEQSSFSLDGLETPESFAITMPIAPDQPEEQ